MITSPSQKSYADECKNEFYALKTGEAAAEHLNKQNDLMAEEAYKHLDKAGLKAGQIVWDIGCGSGCMTEYLARYVTDKGFVYALDISADQLRVTENRLKKANLKNVAFIQGDIASFGSEYTAQADLIYQRLVLMHHPLPLKVLKAIYSLLKPGGAVVLQESIMNTIYTSDDNKNVENCMKTLIKLGASKGVNYNIGADLAALCNEAGFENVQHYFKRLKISATQAKELFIISHWASEAIERGLTTATEVDSWLDTFKNFPEDAPDFYVAPGTQSYVIARKPL